MKIKKLGPWRDDDDDNTSLRRSFTRRGFNVEHYGNFNLVAKTPHPIFMIGGSFNTMSTLGKGIMAIKKIRSNKIDIGN